MKYIYFIIFKFIKKAGRNASYKLGNAESDCIYNSQIEL